MLEEHVRRQVLDVASDNPSCKMFDSLRAAFRSIAAHYLDLVHFPIAYQTDFWGKLTDGQRYVRRLQGKSTQVDYETPVEHTGGTYTLSALRLSCQMRRVT